jgi:hypothetical protein
MIGGVKKQIIEDLLKEFGKWYRAS